MRCFANRHTCTQTYMDKYLALRWRATIKTTVLLSAAMPEQLYAVLVFRQVALQSVLKQKNKNKIKAKMSRYSTA